MYMNSVRKSKLNAGIVTRAELEDGFLKHNKRTGNKMSRDFHYQERAHKVMFKNHDRESQILQQKVDSHKAAKSKFKTGFRPVESVSNKTSTKSSVRSGNKMDELDKKLIQEYVRNSKQILDDDVELTSSMQGVILRDGEDAPRRGSESAVLPIKDLATFPKEMDTSRRFSADSAMFTSKRRATYKRPDLARGLSAVHEPEVDEHT